MEKLKLVIIGVENKFLAVGEKPENKTTNKEHVFVKTEFKGTREWGASPPTDQYRIYALGTLVNVTKDFDPNQEGLIQVGYSSDSYQIRPKLIYKDEKGYFYKTSKRERLSPEETAQVEEFLLMFKEF